VCREILVHILVYRNVEKVILVQGAFSWDKGDPKRDADHSP